VHLVVVFLYRYLSQKGGSARTAGAILLDGCHSGLMDAECRCLSFIFTRLAAERRKYLRRVLALLSITADFAEIDFFALELAVSDD
jgi:hypothetical protein